MRMCPESTLIFKRGNGMGQQANACNKPIIWLIQQTLHAP